MKLPILDVTRPELLEPKLEFCEYPEESSHEAFGPESKDGKARPEKINVDNLLLVNLSFTIATICKQMNSSIDTIVLLNQFEFSNHKFLFFSRQVQGMYLIANPTK